jgi:NitT/TauT family transport system permease protein
MSVITADKSAGVEPRRPVRRKRSPFNSTIGRAVLQAAAVAALLLVWQFGVRIGFVSDFLFGAPSGIYAVFIRMAGNGELLSDTGYTLFEAILGFVIGTIFGSIAGLALWYSIFVARLGEPFIVAINSVP